MWDIWRSIIETGTARIAGVLASAVVLFVTARYLGPEGRGLLVAVVTWVGLFITCANLSVGQVAMFRSAGRGADWLRQNLGTLLVLLGVIVCSSYLVVATLEFSGAFAVFRNVPPGLVALGFLLLPFSIWNDWSRYFLSGGDQVRIYNRLVVFEATLNIAGTLVLVVLLQYGIYGALFSTVLVGFSVAGAGGFFVWRLAGRRIAFKRHELLEVLRGSLKLHVNTFAAFLLLQSDILMMSYYLDGATIGWYQMAVRMVRMVLIVPQAVTVVFYSRIAKAGPDGFWPEQRKIMLGVLALLVGLAAVGYALGPYVIALLAGTAFAPAGKVFRLLLPVLLGMSVAELMQSQWVSRGLFWQTSVLTIGAAVINIAANWVLIPRYGMYGAVAATIVSMAIITPLIQAGFFLWCNRQWRLKFK